jgi:hypothetical protein
MLEFEINKWFQRGHIEKKLTKDNLIDFLLQNFHMYANFFHFFFSHNEIYTYNFFS